jgi:TRAP-type C4-dicarboxylate transport system substrate-binding protein
MSLKAIAKAGAFAAVLAIGVGSAQAQTVTLKFSHFVPPQHTFGKWAVAWTQRIEKESGGRIKFEIYPNGQLVGPPGRQFDAARNGITDLAFTLHGATPGRYAMTELANLPFAWPSAGSSPGVTSRRMTELRKYLEPEHVGLHILYMAVANPAVFYSKEPIKTLADFKGKKVRYAGVQNKYLLEEVGAAPLLIPAPDAQDALAKGIADAAMFPHEAGVAYGLGSVVKYATEPGAATVTFALVMNKAKYDSLPADLKAILDKESGLKGAGEFGDAWAQAEKDGRALLMSKGLEINTFSAADVAEMKKRMAKHVEDAINTLEKQGKPAREFYNAYVK